MTCSHNKLNAEADMRLQLSSVEPDVKDIFAKF